MFERAVTVYVADLDDETQTEIRWPPGSMLPSAGDLFVWQGVHRWIDDVIWEYSENMVGEARVTCVLSLGSDEGGQEVCEHFGERR